VANPHRGEYEVEIGGEKRTFRYSMNKLATLQEQLGVSSIAELVERLDNLGFSEIRYLIWLGIAKFDPETQEWGGPSELEVGEWEIDIEIVGNHLRKAMMRAFRGGKDDEGDEQEEADPTKTAESPTTERDSTTPS
jgi:hypothetical protein